MLALLLLLLSAAPAPAQGARALHPGQEILDPEQPCSLVGRVVDSVRGEPVADRRLALYRSDPEADRRFPEPWVPELGRGEGPRAQVRTDEDGSFRFDGLAPGLWRVRTMSRWLPATEVTALLDDEEPVRRVELVVALGGRVEGEVRDGAGQPMPDVAVFVAGLDRGDGRNEARGNPAARTTTSGVDGRFVLDAIPPGRAFVQAGGGLLGWSEAVELALVEGERRQGLVLVVPDERASLVAAEEGGGVGIHLDFTAEGPRISGLLPGLPAEAAGLRAGDLIATVDGRPTRFMLRSEFLLRCKGPVGTPVRLGILRDGAPREVELLRAPLPAGRR